MEKLVDSGALSGVIDITTTEVCDLLLGGVLPATEDRFGAIARTRVPYIGSCGALDMVNFGPMETVPERYRGRTLQVHNPTVTLMRTTPEENTRSRTLDRRAAQSDGWAGALFPAGGRRICARRAGASRSQIRTPTTELFRALEAHRAPDGDAPAHPHAGAHQRSALFRRDRRRVPPAVRRPADAAPGEGIDDAAHPALRHPRPLPRHESARRADHRRRRRHRHLRQGRGDRRRGPDRHLQFRPLSHGRPRVARRHDAIWRRQRHCGRHGARSAAGRLRHAGSGRRLRHRSVPPDGRVSRRNRAARLQRRAEFSDRRPDRRPLPRRA